MKLKKLIAVALTAVMTMSLTACGGSNTTGTTSGGAVDDGKTYNIGICQLVQHEALDAATKGFKDALTEKLGDKVKFDEQNAQGDSPTCATIVNSFVSENVDLICQCNSASSGGSDRHNRYSDPRNFRNRLWYGFEYQRLERDDRC